MDDTQRLVTSLAEGQADYLGQIRGYRVTIDITLTERSIETSSRKVTAKAAELMAGALAGQSSDLRSLVDRAEEVAELAHIAAALSMVGDLVKTAKPVPSLDEPIRMSAISNNGSTVHLQLERA